MSNTLFYDLSVIYAVFRDCTSGQSNLTLPYMTQLNEGVLDNSHFQGPCVKYLPGYTCGRHGRVVYDIITLKKLVSNTSRFKLNPRCQLRLY